MVKLDGEGKKKGAYVCKERKDGREMRRRRREDGRKKAKAEKKRKDREEKTEKEKEREKRYIYEVNTGDN